MSHLQKTILFIILISFLGCKVSDSSVISNSSKTYNKPIKKIYTLVENVSTFDSLNYDVCLHLKEYFKDKGIVPKFYTRNPLTLAADRGNEEIQQEIEEFSPDVVMTINIISKKDINNDSELSFLSTPFVFVMELKVKEPNDEDLIWRARLNLSGSHIYTNIRRKKIAKAIIKKWESDGLIK